MIFKILKMVKTLVEGDSLKVYMIFKKPMVGISYFEDFQKNRDIILDAMGPGKPHLLLQFGWHVETPERADGVRVEAEAALRRRPDAELVFLCNSERERSLLAERGLRAEYCHQNAFLDENRYAALTPAKSFDAVYVARITPFKRHHLASLVDPLLIIGDYSDKEEGYFREVMRTLPKAAWKRKIFSRFFSQNVCKARCGLCLSAEEGAMFVSTEYLLSGLPLVSTANMGGRDAFFEPPYAYAAKDTPESIREGVEAMKMTSISPAEIRRKTIEKFKPHRDKLTAILQDICDRSGVARDVRAEWPGFFIHKFGLRCLNNPIARMSRTLKRKKR
jgi:hypothetical protein